MDQEQLGLGCLTFKSLATIAEMQHNYHNLSSGGRCSIRKYIIPSEKPSFGTPERTEAGFAWTRDDVDPRFVTTTY
jgi:hypothetical protein